MSSTTAGSSNSSRYLDFDEYVDLKLQKTRSTIKSTDILVALAGVAAMFLAYLLTFVIFDQWVVPGGFGIGLRWLLLSTLLLLTAAWLTWKVGLPYMRSVNRLYAAREIEKADPELKSNLLNLIDLRASGREIEPSILRALEKNAAVGLQNVDVAQAIDHRPLMRTAYVLLAVVMMFCLYALFSPKKISNSIWRSLLPAAEVNVATQTEIIKVEPGDTTILARQTVEVIADIAGDVPNKVWVHYSTSDGKFQNEGIELRSEGEGRTRFRGLLPNVQQDLTYIVKAGDAVSRQYQISVTQPPSATVERIRMEFPGYMKLESMETPGGQIDSWEGTKITVTAHTNIPVKTATIEFLDTPPIPNKIEEPVVVSRDGKQLTASWTLAFNSDGSFSKFYQIQCRTESGATDPTPTVYGLNIRKDQPPEVAFLEPVRDMDVPINAVVPLLIQARDPDFELSHIYLHIKKNGQPIHKEPLSEGHQQQVVLKHDLKVERFIPQVGDTIEIWVQAFDNKQPRPNAKVTPELRLKIVDKISDKEAQQKLADDRAAVEQKLKEVTQENNADGQQNQAPGNPPPEPPGRDPKEPPRGDEPPKAQPEQRGNDDPTSKTKQQNGEADKQPRNGAAGQDPKNENPDPNRGKDGKGQNSKDQPLDPDGDNDKEALERLINAINEQKRNDQPKPQDSDTQNKNQNGSDKKNGSKPGENGQRQDKTDPQQSNPGANNTDGNPPNPKKNPGKTNPEGNNPEKRNPDTTGADKTNTDATKPDSTKPDAPKEEPTGTPPMPQDSSDKPPKPGDGTRKQESRGTPDKPNSDNKSPTGPTDKGPMDKGPMDKGPTDKGTSPDGKGTAPANKPEPAKTPGDKGAEDGMPDGPKPKGKEPGAKDPDKNPSGKEPAGADGTPEKGPPEKEMPTPDANKPPKQGSGNENQEGTGTNNDPKPPMKKGSGNEKKGESTGEEERTGDSPNAEKKTATGDEAGKATPDRDPTSKPTPSKNPDLERDPKETPEKKTSTAKANDPNNPAKQDSDKNVKNPKPQATSPDKEKIDQNDDHPKKAGDNEQKRDGDPNAANEEKKGQGNKEQRSKTGSGGEGGTSKQDSSGDPGSKKSGEGDTTDREGDQQSSNKQTDPKQGGTKKPGTGKDQEGGDKKSGGDKTGSQRGNQKGDGSDGASKDPSKSGESGADGASGQKGGDAEGTPGGKPGQGSATKPGERPGDQHGGGKPGDMTAPSGTGTAIEGEAANLEYKKQATELVLKKLQEELQRGDVDPELLEKLGWTQDEMRRFTERLTKHLQENKSNEETPESIVRRQQFEEMLKSLNLNKQGAARKGDSSVQRDVNQIDSRRSTVPKEYQKVFDAYSREVTRQKSSPKK